MNHITCPIYGICRPDCTSRCAPKNELELKLRNIVSKYYLIKYRHVFNDFDMSLMILMLTNGLHGGKWEYFQQLMMQKIELNKK